LVTVSEQALSLAGFTLAHALWSVSDLVGNDLLCPLVFIERNAQRELVRFEAETQAAAISAGKAQLAQSAADVDRWAFAHEGLINEQGSKVDVVVVLLMAVKMMPSVTLIQRFAPFAKQNHFRLISCPTVSIDGVEQAPNSLPNVLLAVRSGVLEHGAVAKLWNSWNGW